MPIGDPQDGFFYPTLTLIVDSYILMWVKNGGNPDPVCKKFYYILVASPHVLQELMIAWN